MPENSIILVYHTDLLTHAGVIPEYGDLHSLRTSLKLGWCNANQSGVSQVHRGPMQSHFGHQLLGCGCSSLCTDDLRSLEGVKGFLQTE